MRRQDSRFLAIPCPSPWPQDLVRRQMSGQMMGGIVQVLGAGRAGTATLCYLDAKDTLLIAQYSNLRDFFSLPSFKKLQCSRKLRYVTLKSSETQNLMFAYCKIFASYHTR